jgi:hypothetical protein
MYGKASARVYGRLPAVESDTPLKVYKVEVYDQDCF